MYLSELTTHEVDALDRGTPVVVPFAATEQHGPHLPLGTDSYITEGIVRRLDRQRAQSFLWLPVAHYGASSHHMARPGTLTLSSRTFLDVARELVECFVAHGFRRFLLFNGHGGNQSLLNVAVQEVRLGAGRVVVEEGRRHLRVVHATYWVIAAEAFARIRDSAPGGMGHAGEMETSAMLALHPELVRTASLTSGGDPPRSRFDSRDMLAPGPVGQFRLWEEWTRTGVLGDPSSARAEKGERFLDAAAAAVAELLDALREERVG